MKRSIVQEWWQFYSDRLNTCYFMSITAQSSKDSDHWLLVDEKGVTTECIAFKFRAANKMNISIYWVLERLTTTCK